MSVHHSPLTTYNKYHKESKLVRYTERTNIHCNTFFTMQNILFEYLYRDGANYKNHGYVIFSNNRNFNLDEIEVSLREKMFDGEWFCAMRWQVPDLHFEKWDCEVDHLYHEFSFIEYTSDPPTETRDIKVFLSQL